MCEVAEEAGYSRDICSYARTDIGNALGGKGSPVGKVPPPDLLVCCTNICQTVLYWYRVLADHFRVPLIIIDTPFLFRGALEHQLAYVQRQLEDMIPVAEGVAGRANVAGGSISSSQRFAADQARSNSVQASTRNGARAGSCTTMLSPVAPTMTT